MADEPRERFERVLFAAWGRELATQLKTVKRQIIESLPFDSPVTWVTAEVRGAQFTRVILEEIFITTALDVGSALGQELVVVEKSNAIKQSIEDIIGDRGVAWATDYSFELVRGINSTTLGKLRRIIPRSLQEGLSIDEIAGRLAPTFGRSRAQSIAVTETTRATVIGQREFITQLNKVGVYTDTFWLTARDSRVDDLICRPLDGEQRINGVYQHPSGNIYNGPPAHPNCRCTENDKLTEELLRETIEEEGPTPELSPLSDNFRYRQSRLSPSFDHSLQALDDVFEVGDFDFGEIEVSGYSGRGEGKFNPQTGKIQINRTAEHKEFTFLHEIGHAMDYDYLPQALDIEGATASLGGSFSDAPTAMDGFWKAIDESDAIKELRDSRGEDPDGIKYLLDVREVQARAFAQYVAETSNDELLLWELDAIREDTWYSEQWATKDFAPIKDALDAVFETAGILGG